MTILSDSVLLESKSARDNQLARVSHDRAATILGKVKGLYFALWQGVGAATTEQMREFFEVNIDAVEAALRRCRTEFQSDGLKTLKGKQIKDFKHVSALEAETSKAPSLTIWTPRAALRLGMVLQDSPVAKAVRTSLLDAVEVIPTAVDKVRELKLQKRDRAGTTRNRAGTCGNCQNSGATNVGFAGDRYHARFWYGSPDPGQA